MVNTKLVRSTPQRDYRPSDAAIANAHNGVILTENEAVESIAYIESITDPGLTRHTLSMDVLARVVPA